MALYLSPEDTGYSGKVVTANRDDGEGTGPVGHEVEEIVMGCKLKLVDIAVSGGVLKTHNASGDIDRPLVDPKLGVPVGAPKNASYTGI